jgi:hypothetical protein
VVGPVRCFYSGVRGLIGMENMIDWWGCWWVVSLSRVSLGEEVAVLLCVGVGVGVGFSWGDEGMVMDDPCADIYIYTHIHNSNNI